MMDNGIRDSASESDSAKENAIKQTTKKIEELEKDGIISLLHEAERRETQLRQEKHERDEEFGHLRAVLKQICIQIQNDESSQDEPDLESVVNGIGAMKETVSSLQKELSEVRSVAVFAESSTKMELETIRQRYALEMESMEQAMRATIDDAVQDAESRWQNERRQQLETIRRLRMENDELKSRTASSSPDRNNGGNGFFASISKKVSATSPFSLPSSTSLNSLAFNAKEENNLVRGMEKAKLDADVLKSIVVPLEEEITVLRSQLQEANEKIEYYEKEKLKIESVSPGGIDALTKKMGTKDFDLSTASKSDIEMYLGVMQTQKLVLQDDAVTTKQELQKTKKLLEREQKLVQYYRKCLSAAHMGMAAGVRPNVSEDSLDNPRSDTLSLRSLDAGDDSSVVLADLINLSGSGEFDFTPSSTTIADSSSGTNSPKPAQAATTNSAGLCAMCSNYEAQLQTAQATETKLKNELAAAERSIERIKDDLNREHQFRDEMDRKLSACVADSQGQISELYKKQMEAEKLMSQTRSSNQDIRIGLEQTIREMIQQRENLSKELAFLQSENDKLIDRYAQNSRSLQEEIIDLPNNVEDLQLILLQYREDVIKSRVAKEHIEESLRSENMFLKDQLTGEQQNKESMVEMLSREIDALRERAAILESEKMDFEFKWRQLMDKKLEEVVLEQQKTETLLKAQLTNMENERQKLEKDLHHLKSRIQVLQVELDNSEAVQRDFVKLSQSLQVELEKIRQSENEVRWQFDEDVEDCNACHQAFLLPKKKVRSLKIHCRHCGKIFCHDCLSKEVPGGPNRRPAKVCDVCHTILNRDTAPYFSYSPPSPK